jgi:hypothetical protein
MSSLKSLAAVLLLGSLAVLTIACGSSASPRYLRSMVVSPNTADANDYPGGLVQFTATGTYNRPPSVVQMTSTVDQSFSFWVYDTSIATVVSTSASTGVVTLQCLPGTSGTATVIAEAANLTPAPIGVGALAPIQGRAKLTCP